MKNRTGKETADIVEMIITKVRLNYKFQRKTSTLSKKEKEKLRKEYNLLPTEERIKIDLEKREKEKVEADKRREKNIKIKNERDLYIIELCNQYNISVNHIRTIGGFNNLELDD